MQMRWMWVTVLLAWVWVAAPALAVPREKPSASLIHFTDDTTMTGKPLRPDFLHHSSWCAIGRGPRGNIYIAVSNHQRPGGNVLIYKYDPKAAKLKVLDDIKAVSSRVDNWIDNESQHKVHTFLQTHADGKVYFASMNAAPSPVLRGAHLYRIDPADDSIEDITHTLALNTGGKDQGVLVDRLGVRGMALHPKQPNTLYVMTYPGGDILRVDLQAKTSAKVARSSHDNFVMYAAPDGSLYFGDGNDAGQALKRYDPAAQQTTTVADRLPPGEFGAFAPVADGSGAYVLFAENKQVFFLDTKAQRLGYVATLCGKNFWRLYNLHLSPSGKNLYFVSNNNEHRKTIRRLHIKTGLCRGVLDVNELLGTRKLCFGGMGVWDDQGAFYAPVWTMSRDKQDLAILRAVVEEPGRP